MLWVSFKSYWTQQDTLTDEQKEFVKEFWPDYSSFDDTFRLPSGHVRMSWEEAQVWMDKGFKLDIESSKSTMLSKSKKEYREDGDPIEQLYSGKLFQLTIPDIGLLSINEVDWLDDCCTEALQDKLDQGWRILAVCPPNAQRRPDYILGRTKSKP